MFDYGLREYGYGGGPMGYGGGKKGYNPFADSSLALWLEARSGLYQERTGASATTAAASNGDPVGTWRDRRGAINGMAGADTRRPVFRPTGVNGRAGVQFDGTDDAIDFTTALASAFRNKPHIYAIVAFQAVSSAAIDNVLNISIAGSTNNRASIVANANGVAGRLMAVGRRLDADSAQVVSATPGFISNTPQVSTGLFNYATSDLYIRTNGAVVASNTSFQTDGNTSDTDSLAVAVGALSAGGANSSLDGLLSVVMLFTPQSAFTSSELLARERYAGQLSGVAF